MVLCLVPGTDKKNLSLSIRTESPTWIKSCKKIIYNSKQLNVSILYNFYTLLLLASPLGGATALRVNLCLNNLCYVPPVARGN